MFFNPLFFANVDGTDKLISVKPQKKGGTGYLFSDIINVQMNGEANAPPGLMAPESVGKQDLISMLDGLISSGIDLSDLKDISLKEKLPDDTSLANQAELSNLIAFLFNISGNTPQPNGEISSEMLNNLSGFDLSDLKTELGNGESLTINLKSATKDLKIKIEKLSSLLNKEIGEDAKTVLSELKSSGLKNAENLFAVQTEVVSKESKIEFGTSNPKVQSPLAFSLNIAKPNEEEKLIYKDLIDPQKVTKENLENLFKFNQSDLPESNNLTALKNGNQKDLNNEKVISNSDGKMPEDTGEVKTKAADIKLNQTNSETTEIVEEFTGKKVNENVQTPLDSRKADNKTFAGITNKEAKQSVSKTQTPEATPISKEVKTETASKETDSSNIQKAEVKADVNAGLNVKEEAVKNTSKVSNELKADARKVNSVTSEIKEVKNESKQTAANPVNIEVAKEEKGNNSQKQMHDLNLTKEKVQLSDVSKNKPAESTKAELGEKQNPFSGEKDDSKEISKEPVKDFVKVKEPSKPEIFEKPDKLTIAAKKLMSNIDKNNYHQVDQVKTSQTVSMKDVAQTSQFNFAQESLQKQESLSVSLKKSVKNVKVSESEKVASSEGEKKTEFSGLAATKDTKVTFDPKQKTDLFNNNGNQKHSSEQQFQNVNSAKVNDTFINELNNEPKFTGEATKTVRSSEIIKEISKFIQAQDKNSLTIKIEPENLGKMKIQLEITDKVVKANIEVENHAVKTLLESNIKSLQQNLNQSGVQLNNVNISLANHEQKQNQKFMFSKKRENKKGGFAETIENVENNEIRKQKSLGYNTMEFIA